MNLNAKFTLKIRNFFRKHGKKIITAIVIWAIIIVINNYLKNHPKEEEMVNTYNPDAPIIDDNGDVPIKYREDAKSTIDLFFKYCNAKQYEKAYEMLSDSCKEYVYNTSIEEFKKYVDGVYTSSKIYNIQNYSNLKNIYIYDMNILDDIESTGTTGGYNVYQEKVAVIRENSQFKIANQGFIKTEFLDANAEDDKMKVKVNSKDISYSKEGYNFEITNKTDKYIVISDGQNSKEVTLNLGDQLRSATNLVGINIVIPPNSTMTATAIFDKFCDDNKKVSEINFNYVRVIDKYNITTGQAETETETAYSFNIKMN